MIFLLSGEDEFGVINQIHLFSVFANNIFTK